MPRERIRPKQIPQRCIHLGGEVGESQDTKQAVTDKLARSIDGSMLAGIASTPAVAIEVALREVERDARGLPAALATVHCAISSQSPSLFRAGEGRR